jgi:hypothetical protein
LFLLYALYYPADWSGAVARTRIDHLGDLEGAALVADLGRGRVTRAITQAHGRFYLWVADASDPEAAAAAGGLTLSPDGRAVLFAESGGHGLYAFGQGRWRPKGGRDYAEGPAGVGREALACLDPELRPLEELLQFLEPGGRRFRGLPAKARTPWAWARLAPVGDRLPTAAEVYRRLRARVR